LPEYAFVYWAAVKDNYEMAVGSAIGSCTLLITLGYGLVILFSTTKVSRKPVKEIVLSKATKVDALYLLITGVLAFIFVKSGNELTFVEGLILTAVLLGYVIQVFMHSAKSEDSTAETAEVTPRQMVISFAQLIAGGAIIFFCSERFVDSMVALANLMRVSPAVIAIVLGPLASEMPEKLTAYMLVIRNGAQAELAICNFLGSKVNHNSLLLAVMPFVAHFKNHDAVTGIMSPMFMIMTGFTVVVSALLVRGRLQKWEGWMLTAAYVITMYIAVGMK
jgi:cation:H+ antiporter